MEDRVGRMTRFAIADREFPAMVVAQEDEIESTPVLVCLNVFTDQGVHVESNVDLSTLEFYTPGAAVDDDKVNKKKKKSDG